MLSNKYSKVLGLALCMTPSLLWGATNAESDSWMTWALDNVLIILIAMVVALVMLALWNTVNTMINHETKRVLDQQGIEVTSDKLSRESIFSKLYNKLSGLVPMEKENDLDLGHNYDGIRELDNSLPPWWLYLFYFTIIFGIGYLYIYHYSGIGSSSREAYAADMEQARIQRSAFLFKQANLVNEENVVAVTESGGLEEGQKVFTSLCASCHGQLGEGGVGPNFADRYWIHGGSINDVFKTIKYGVPEKGMISWQTQLQPVTMQQVASYILTLQGTNPPNQKAPQGELYEAEVAGN